MTQKEEQDEGLSGRGTVLALMSQVANLDLPVVTEDGEPVVGVVEQIWSPDEMALAGASLKGRIVLKTKGNCKRREKLE